MRYLPAALLAFSMFGALSALRAAPAIQAQSLPSPAGAGPQSEIVASEHARARLILSRDRVRPGEIVYAALLLEMDPEWHTYWKNPGDSGAATRIDWSLELEAPGAAQTPSDARQGFPDAEQASDANRNLEAGPILWPVPARIPAPPLMSYGYSGEVALLTRLRIPENLKASAATTETAGRDATGHDAGRLRIKADVEWLECKEICLPGFASLATDLTLNADSAAASNSGDNAHAANLQSGHPFWRTAFARLPRSSEMHNLSVESRLEESAVHLRIDLPDGLFVEPRQLDQAYFFPAQAGLAEHAAPQELRLAGPNNDASKNDDGFLAGGREDVGPRILEIRIPAAFAEEPGDRISGVLVLPPAPGTESRGEAWELEAAYGAGDGGIASGFAAAFAALGLAFVGGLILNLMPCVLPALSLKVFALVRHAGESRRERLLQAGAFAAGVLLAMTAMAGALLILRGMGAAAGWGYQLQSPGFVFFLTVFFFGFALWMLGVFEAGSGLAALGGRAEASLARETAAHDSSADSPESTPRLRGLAFSFGTGLLVVLVATPCTAPFMGSALGYALAQPAWLALSVFGALGLGLAAPYVLLAAFPALLQRLPRPGPWMQTLQQFLGFLLAAAALWLLWVLVQLSGTTALIPGLAALWLVALGAWILGRRNSAGRAKREPLALVAALFAWVLALALPFVWPGALGGNEAATTPRKASDAARNPTETADDFWRPFDAKALAEARAAGRPVFVNFTADWCLSCKVNEAVVFSREDVQAAFRETNTLALRADWTRRDADLQRRIEALGRSGVPVYAYYPAGAASPELWPEILTPGLALRLLGN